MPQEKEKEPAQKEPDADAEGGEEGAAEGEISANFTPKEYIPEKQWKLDGYVLLDGKRRFGKTVCLQWLLSKVGRFYPRGVYVFSKTKHNRFWSQHVPEERIYPEVNWEVIKQIKQDQVTLREQMQQTGKRPVFPYVLIIMDDVVSDEYSMRYKEDMLALALEGRHYFITLAICSQDIKGIPPKIRQNVDQVFITTQTQARQIKQLEEDFASLPWINKKQFRILLKANTQNYSLLVVDQSTPNLSVDEMFFTVHPEEEVEPYKLGDDDFWKESGCDWKNQLRIWANCEKTKLPSDITDPEVEKALAKHYRALKKKIAGQEHGAEYDENGVRIMKTAAHEAMDPDKYAAWLAKKAEQQAALSARGKMEADMKFLYKMYEPAPPNPFKAKFKNDEGYFDT